VKTRQPERVLSGHTDDVTDLAFAPDGSKLATASRDRTVRLWSVPGPDCATLEQDQPVTSVAWSPNGRLIATGGGADRCVSIWSDPVANPGWEEELRRLPSAERGLHIGGYAQRLVSRKQLELPPGGKLWVGSLAFTRDSEELFVAWGVGLSADDHAERGASFFNLTTGQCRPGFRSRGYFRGVRGAMSADGRHAVTTGGNDHEIALWRSGDGELLRLLRGQGRTPLRVGWKPDGWVLGWGYAGADGAISKERPLQRAFDLAAQRFEPQPDFAAFQREQHTRGELALEIPPAGDHAAVRWESAARTSFSWNSNGEKWGLNAVVPSEYRRLVRCGTVLHGGRVLVGGDLGLYVHNVLKQARDDRFWQGCGESAWSLAARSNGRHVLAAHGDQTLRVWDPSQERPLLSLFIADNEWVVWTPEGYYAASPGGERFLGWQVGESPTTLCSFHGIAQFRKSLHRPDVIAHLLQTGSVTQAVQLADREGGRKTQTVAADKALPPRVALLAPDRKQLSVGEPQFVLRAAAEGVGPNALRSMELRLDGRPCSAPHTARLVSSSANPVKMEMEWTVTLPVGTHQLSVLARGERSDAVSDPVEVTCTATGRSAEEQPNLYVLSVGIMDYTDPLLAIPYADRDARELAATFEAKSKGLFRKVETRVLVNRKATRGAVLDELQWLRKQARPQDRVVIFYAGRGTSGERGEYRLLPCDADTKQLADTTLAGTELKKRIAGVPGRVLLLLDLVPVGATGRPDPLESRAREALVRELADEDCGASVLVSAMSHQASLVNPVPEHSLFTAALVEGLSGHGLVDKRDWAVYLHQLVAHVADRVGKGSEGKQTPYLVAPVGARPMALSKP
jgi:WD40 repeat protein